MNTEQKYRFPRRKGVVCFSNTLHVILVKYNTSQDSTFVTGTFVNQPEHGAFNMVQDYLQPCIAVSFKTTVL